MSPRGGTVPWTWWSVCGSNRLLWLWQQGRWSQGVEERACPASLRRTLPWCQRSSSCSHPWKQQPSVSEKNPTIPIIAPTLAKLQEHFDPDDSDLLVISEMKDRFRQDFSTCYTYIQDFLWKASALDPRFKALEFLNDDHIRNTVYLGITAEVENMVIMFIKYILTPIFILP